MIFQPEKRGLSPDYILWGSLILFFLMHLYQISAPPNGYHKWRESDTAAVSLNYYQDDMNFFHPKINQRGEASGITGSEFPIYNYSGALLYKIFGASHTIHRLLSIFGGMVAIYLLFLSVTLLTKDKLLAALTAFSISFSPLFYFYSYKIMPDIWMLMFLLGAVYGYLKYLKSNKIGFWFLSALSLTLSATLKPLSLSIYLPFLILTLSNSTDKLKQFIRFSLYVIITFLPTLSWYLYARHLNEIYQTPGYYLGDMLGIFYKYLFTAQFFKKLFLQWPFELWIGWPMVIFFVIGAVLYVKKKMSLGFFSWLLACYIAFLFISYHSSSHDYYTLIAVPPFALFTGLGLKKLTEIKFGKIILPIIIIIVPILTFLRVDHRIDDVPEFEPMRTDAAKIIPQEARVMVEDGTTSIKLYQLNRTGWPLRGEIKYGFVKECVDKGGEFIILENRINNYDDSIKYLFDSSFVMIDSLYCYRTKE